jgi:hypothetical protein
MNAYILARPLAADLVDADKADKLGWIALALVAGAVLPAQGSCWLHENALAAVVLFAMQ